MADINLGTVAYVLGILSIVFAFFSPIAGLILGIIGLVQSRKQGVTKAKKLNVIGIILSIVLLIISIIFLVYSVKSGLSPGSFPLF